ncbi:hypothetical protein WJX72_000445 [[Myrmecia] bisecta]|uniref:ATP-grasp domain-containing protein n=1 Tax=[Myrmecia] bisecta TaxID=41462 RepID=A0AAW1PSL1_9CHLO
MQKKSSALTAALSGRAAPSDSAAKTQTTDVQSFPCLDDERTRGVASVAAGISTLSLKEQHQQLAGTSAPTTVLLPDGSLAADYDLNPYRRRGGEERIPTQATSVEGKHQWRRTASLSSNFMVEAVIGSLPSGLSMEERQHIVQSTPLSPTLNLLSSMPLDRVNDRSLDGRQLRRHVLRGAVLVFITAGYSGKRFIFQKARELGVRSVIIDGPDSWCQMLEQEKIIEKFVPLDFSDAETVFDRCCQALNQIKKTIGELDGVCTFCEMAVPLVARLAEKFGLPGNTPDAVDGARDKHTTRAIMEAAGLPTPRNMLITSAEEVTVAAQKVRFPAVIKPIYGAASIGVVRVDNLEQLKKTFIRVAKEMAGARIVAGALTQGDDADGEASPNLESLKGNAGSWIKTTLMLEEYLDGPEVDVDLVFSEGQPVYGAITDNWPTVEPYFNETGSNCPSVLPKKQQQELMDLAVKSVAALGLTQGVFHVELKYTSRGPRLIEVNCRMGGGPVRDTNLLVWGVDLVEEHLLTAAGIPSRPPVAPKPICNIAEYSINAYKTGKIQHTHFHKEWESHPDVLYVRPLVQAGQKVTSVTDGMPTLVCELMVTKPGIEEAISFVKHIADSLEIPIE